MSLPNVDNKTSSAQISKGFPRFWGKGFGYFPKLAFIVSLSLAAALPGYAQSGEIVGLGNKCIDLFQANSDDGTPVVLWECSGNANQEWRFAPATGGDVEIQGLAGKCIIPGDIGSSGHPELEIAACGAEQAKWGLEGSLGSPFKLVHDESGLCLDVLGSNTANGTPLIAFSCVNQVNQEWRLTKNRDVPAYILPFFEADRSFESLTTFFAVRNPASYPVTVRYEYFAETDSPGEASFTEVQELDAGAVRTRNIETTISFTELSGWVGITAVDEATGKHLAVQDLYGDYFRVDSFEGFATGERLLDSETSLCQSWHIRFLNGGDFNGGTSFRFFVPEFDGQSWTATGRVFNEQGQEIQTLNITSDRHSTRTAATSLPLIPSFGVIEWTFQDGVRGHLSAVMDALGRFSVGFEAECRD